MTALAPSPNEQAEESDFLTESLWRETLTRILRQRSAVIGLVIIAILGFLAIAAPVIAPYDPITSMLDMDIEGVKKRTPPCIHILGCPDDQPQFIMGLDGNLRDLFSRVIYGTRISFQVGFVTVAFALFWGTLLGAIAGYAGGWLDNVIMRVLDVVLAFPSLLLAIAIVTALGPGLINAMLAIAFVTIPHYARVVRSTVIVVRELEFVEASKALGATSTQILFLRILPNAISPLIVQATLGIGTAILDAAALSFIGLGAQPPMPEWGWMVSAERNQIFSAPHLVFFPGLFITLTVLAFNLLGDGLRDALDPRLVNIGK
jgi:ABC-type dipeptide/oligopeptide/nickel transport system permease subunit